jgi:hypothetical protein
VNSSNREAEFGRPHQGRTSAPTLFIGRDHQAFDKACAIPEKAANVFDLPLDFPLIAQRKTERCHPDLAVQRAGKKIRKVAGKDISTRFNAIIRSKVKSR